MLVSALVVLLFILAAAAVGLLVIAHFASLRSLAILDVAFAALTIGVLLLGWLALLLAELNQFSGPRFLLLWLLLVSILLIASWQRSKLSNLTAPLPPPPAESLSWTQSSAARPFLIPLVLIWLVAAAWLFFRPHEYVLGGADAGVYVSLGAEIAQNGGFRVSDPILAALDPAVRSAFLRPLPANPVAPSYVFPGFYVTGEAEGRITPQFYPLHPVWNAVGFGLSPSEADGAGTALLLTGLWITLGSLALVFLGSELGGWFAAVLLLGGLAVTALQVWFGRYPTTEALTQYLLWAGLWSLYLWFDKRRPEALWAFLAGMALGSVFLVRIDILVLAPVFAVFLFGLWYRGWRPADTWFAIPFVLLVGHSVLHGFLLSAPYFYETVGFGLSLLWKNAWILILAASLGLGLFWAAWAIRKRGRDFSRYKRPFLVTVIALFLLFALYNWFIRPYAVSSTLRPDAYSETLLLITNHENFLRLGWYLALPGIWLGVAGICWMIWRVDSKTAVLVSVGLLFTVTYLWDNRANPHQVYVMRRYVPAVVPLFLLGAAVLLAQIEEKGRDLLGTQRRQGAALLVTTLLLSIVWLVGLGWSARGFISQVDYGGLLDQLSAFEAQLPPESILLFDDQAPVGQGDFWGTPLTYIFGHQAYTIRDAAILEGQELPATIASWQENGRSVVWFGDPAWLDANGIGYQEKPFTIISRRLEGSYEHKPTQIIDETWALEAALLEPAR